MFVALILSFFLQTTTIDIGGKSLAVEIADTPKTRAKGLMGRKDLPEGRGMLFVFEKPTIAFFYMKNTAIPLSIGFFNEEKILIDLKDMNPLFRDAPTAPLVRSALPAQYALEVPQGWFQKNGISLGAKFAFRKGEPVVKLQFGPKSALTLPDSDFSQIAYTDSHMVDLRKTKPALRSSNLDRKASFTTGSLN